MLPQPRCQKLPLRLKCDSPNTRSIICFTIGFLGNGPVAAAPCDHPTLCGEICPQAHAAHVTVAYRGQFYPTFVHKTHHSSPVRSRYSVSFVDPILYLHSVTVTAVKYVIVTFTGATLDGLTRSLAHPRWRTSEAMSKQAPFVQLLYGWVSKNGITILLWF